MPGVAEVFLTPRVIDQSAFDELGLSLRQIVQAAARQSADLRAAVAQADRLRVQLQTGEQSQQDNLTLAAEAVTRIEQRAKEAEGFLEQARTALPSTQAFEDQVRELVAKRLAGVESRLEAMAASATARAESAERRIAEACQSLEARVEELGRGEAAKFGPAMQQLDLLVQRAEALASESDVDATRLASATQDDNATAAGESPQTLGALVKRAEAMTQQTAFANKQLDAVRKQADQARSILGESLNDMCAMIDRLSERAEGLRAEADRAKATAAEVGREVDERVANARARLDGSARSIDELGLGVRVADETATELRRLLAQLEPWASLVQPGSDDQQIPAPIQTMIARGQHAAQRELATIAEALRLAAGRIEGQAQSVAVQAVEPNEVTVTALRREWAEVG